MMDGQMWTMRFRETRTNPIDAWTISTLSDEAFPPWFYNREKYMDNI